MSDEHSEACRAANPYGDVFDCTCGYFYRPDRLIVPIGLFPPGAPQTASLEEFAEILVDHVLGGSPGVLRYRELVAEWMAARAARESAGSELSQEEESDWTEKVDAVWRGLSGAEQEYLDPPDRKALGSRL